MRRLRQPANVALLAAGTAAAVVLALILRHAVFVTNDSLNNYAHVWYVSHQLWQAHSLPLRMPVLAHGDAFAFPYSFLPWLTAALVRPLLGDWAVTLWLVLGAVGVLAASWWSFPELRGGWWTAALIINPMLVESLLLGQLPFLWAAALGLAAIGCWRRGWRWQAATLLGLAEATHPAVLLPLAGLLVLGRLPWEPRKLALLAAFAASLVIAAPAAWLTLASPVVDETSRGALAVNFFQTFALRALVVAAPFIGLIVLRTPLARAPALVLAILLALNGGIVSPRHDQFAWGALTRQPQTASLLRFVHSPDFVPGATYRVLSASDGKVSMYEMIRHDGRLDSEFFPESIQRRDWRSLEDYRAFLQHRRVDYVIIYDSYDALYRTNEHRLLRELATAPGGGPACARMVRRGDGFDVYSVRPACNRAMGGGSLPLT